ncbi:transposase [Paenibacillus sp. cl123]|uniref:transposase n=1 Tax=unclassified Paenibacillus TaxID=185978 RepID=UPI00352397CD
MSSGATIWTNCFNELKYCGVQDILITNVDHLTGFSQAIHRRFVGRLTLRTSLRVIIANCGE